MSFVAVAVAGVGAAAAIGGAALSASSQANAAESAAQTQAESADQATALQREMYYQTRQDLAPWRRAGMWALPQMQRLIARGPGQPFRGPAALDPRAFAFQAPTAETMQVDPSYQWRLQQGQHALESSAAARGGLLSGGAMRGAMELGQNMASQEYGNIYGRAFGENQLRYGRALTRNQDQYGRALTAWQARQGQRESQYNRLAGLAGVGQQTSQYLGTLGANYANQAGELALQRGNALSQGQITAGNAWGNVANTAGNALGGLGMYAMMRPPPSPQQSGYMPYSPNSQPFDPWAW